MEQFKRRRTTVCLLASLLIVKDTNQSQVYTSSYEDCVAFSDTFLNTCNNNVEPGDLANVYKVKVSCGQVGQCAGEYNERSKSCKWDRQMCVTCSLADNGSTYIRVQSNGMPSSCYWSEDIMPVEQNIDFVTLWNYDVKGKVNNYVFNTALDISQELCDSERLFYENVPVYTDFEMIGDADLSKTGGVMLDGTLFNSVINDQGFDPFYPPPEYQTEEYLTDEASLIPITTEYQLLDTCVGFPNEEGQYSYFFAPVCIADIDLDEPNEILDTQSAYDYLYSSWNDYGVRKPIGIAFDGHIIWSPFKESGDLYLPCDVDVCNGVFMEGEYYGYVATTFFPYTVGCYGPGNSVSQGATCSSNTGDFEQSCESGQYFSQINVFGLAMLGSVISYLM